MAERAIFLSHVAPSHHSPRVSLNDHLALPLPAAVCLFSHCVTVSFNGTDSRGKHAADVQPIPGKSEARLADPHGRSFRQAAEFALQNCTKGHCHHEACSTQGLSMCTAYPFTASEACYGILSHRH